MIIGVFGSAVNPMTMGHVDAITQALEFCDKVIVLPSFSHAHGKVMADFEVRVQLATATVDHELHGRPVEVSTIERELAVGDKPVYTVDVLGTVQSIYPDDEIIFLCGTDNIDKFTTFHKSDEILSRWAVRELLENKAIRSTIVRNNILHGKPITGLVSDSIINEISKIY